MDFKLNREIFTASEAVSSSGYEQAIELDYILPDYYPDIFRVLKCRMSPRIVSQSVNGDKLNLQLDAKLKVMYVSENSNKVCCVEQKLTYTRTCEIPLGLKNPCITASVKPDYINCRAVNQRRLDMRGAATIRVNICGDKSRTAISGAVGGGVQLLCESVTYPTARLNASKRITIVEELELGDAKPPVSAVLRNDCIAAVSEMKIVSGKLVLKGEAFVNMLYSCDEGEGSVESMRFSVPFSQIIDVEGLDERYDCRAGILQSSCEILVKGDERKTLECEIVLFVQCKAVRYETGELATDVYSTKCGVEAEISEEKIESVPVSVCEPHSQTARLVCRDGEIAAVYDSRCAVSNVSGRYSFDKNCLIVGGNLTFSLLGKNESGAPVYLETDAAFEHCIESECVTQDSVIEPRVELVGCSYTLADAETVEIKADLSICGEVFKQITKKLVTDIKLTDSAPDKSRTAALTLCYAKEGERVWDIAKRYLIPVSAVMTENDLAADILDADKMLLIPDAD